MDEGEMMLYEFWEELKGRLRSTAEGRVEAAHVEGFEAASEICMQAIKDRGNQILRSHSAATPLNDGDQAVLAALNELQAQIEKDLRFYWRPRVQ